MKKKTNSELLFEEMIRNSKKKKSTRYKRIYNLKKACDTLELMRGEFSFAEVSRLCKGNPAKQTIYNNRDFKEYVKLRKLEYLEKNYPINNRKSKTDESHYPSSNLDLKTKKEFDDLLATIKFQEKIIKQLESELEAATFKRPENLSKSIEQGPDQELNLLTNYVNPVDPSFNQLPKALVSALRILFETINSLPDISIHETNGKRALIREKEFGHDIILHQEELNTVERILLKY